MAHAKLAIFRRRFLATCSAISLLLCLATVVLWVRSYWTGDLWVYDSNNRVAGLGSGRLGMFLVLDDDNNHFFHSGFNHWQLQFDARETFAGFALIWRGPTRAISVPHWLPAILFTIAPTSWLIAHRRRAKRSKLGLCLHCGYDLRATPDRCPECGLKTET